MCMSEQAIFGDAIIGFVPRSLGGWAMGQWLIADVAFFDTHLQLWMLLVAGIVLLWFLYVWATR
jgi:hypothetical protein